MAHPELPLDIWEHIAAILGKDIDPDLPKNSDPLKALSLTTTALISLCQKQLFGTLLLNTDLARSSRFKSVVAEKPRLVSYIKVLDFRFEYHDSINVDTSDIDGHGILEILLDQSTILKSISVSSTSSLESSFPSTDWETIPSLWQTLFKRLIRLPTVTKLTLAGLHHVPTHIFYGCGNITHLVLGEMDFIKTSNDPEDEFSDISPNLISFEVIFSCYDAIKFLLQSRNHNNHMPVNFSGMKRIYMPYLSPSDQQAVWDLLPIARGLESFEIYTAFRTAFTKLGTSLASYTCATLKQLKVHLSVYGVGIDPLCGLVKELEIITGSNIIEEISLVLFLSDEGCNQDTEDWTDFDSLLTTPGSFPKLRSVSMSICWDTTFGRADEVDILNRITDQRFPALLASEEVDFDFSAINRFHTYTQELEPELDETDQAIR